ncbi:MAG TPA: nuclear transport factor 2 family protein [Steroidobacteraceae bacterium]|nr:nuclear transport factor 2 family protein [Steroidobacteraceae bacterium]
MRHAFALAALLLASAAGGLTGAARASAAGSQGCVPPRIARLQNEIAAAEDVLAIEKLQRAYGYYVDKGMWEDVADLFTEDAVANYPAGVFIGHKSIREHLYMNVGGKPMGELGLGDGRLYNHMNIQPVVHLDRDSHRTARGRWRALAMFGNYGGGAVWAEGVYEIRYRKEGNVWKIARLDYYDGFGAPYQTGWAAPATPGAGAPGGGPRRGFRHLAHPPDEPRESCGGFPKACIAPFDYSNPGTTIAGAQVWWNADGYAGCDRDPSAAAQAAELLHRATLLQDAQQIENLQRIYGYYLDRALWDQVADLFSDDGTIEMGQRGVYAGKRRIRAFLDLLGHHGLTYGWLNDHIQLQPIVDVAPDGRTARLRSRELDMTGVYGKWGKWSEGTYENTFVKQGGVWKFQSLHYYPTFISDYDKGWAKDAEPVPTASAALPPDRPPTEIYAIYPKAFVPAFHYRNPVTGEPPRYPAVGAPSAAAAAAALMPAANPGAANEAPGLPPVRDVNATLAQAERIVSRVKDYDELENLESAYGYYLDKDLWTDLANLFADHGSMELAQRGVYEGRNHIHQFLLQGLGRGHQGPVPGMLGNHLQLQPVIDIASDGRTAKIRNRALQQMAFGSRAAIAAGVYENEAVKVGGIWRFSKDHVFNTLAASYIGGWAHAARPEAPGESKAYPPDAPPTVKFEMFPVVYDIPFHYANPVTGRTAVPPIAQEDAAAMTPVRADADPPEARAPAPMMIAQTDELTKARADIGRPVEHVLVPNHSHISETYAVGTADESLCAPVMQFIRQTVAQQPH